jgi:hypothetical protein
VKKLRELEELVAIELSLRAAEVAERSCGYCRRHDGDGVVRETIVLYAHSPVLPNPPKFYMHRRQCRESCCGKESISCRALYLTQARAVRGVFSKVGPSCGDGIIIMLFVLIPLLATAGGGLLLWKTNVGERVLSVVLTKVFSILGEQGNVQSLENGRGKGRNVHGRLTRQCFFATRRRAPVGQCGAATTQRTG